MICAAFEDVYRETEGRPLRRIQSRRRVIFERGRNHARGALLIRRDRRGDANDAVVGILRPRFRLLELHGENDRRECTGEVDFVSNRDFLLSGSVHGPPRVPGHV